MKKMKLIAMTLIAALSIGLLAGCGGGGNNESSGSEAAEGAASGGSQSITASGSTAILPLAKADADEFKKDNADVSITINGGGSGSGLKQVAEGTVDIGNSDVEASAKLDESMAKDLVDHKVCVITMVPVINKDLAKDVPDVTKEQLKGIFTGKIKNWKEVGGPDEEIVLIVRPKTSGTRALFEEYALDGESGIDGALETDDSGSLLKIFPTKKGPSVMWLTLTWSTTTLLPPWALTVSNRAWKRLIMANGQSGAMNTCTPRVLPAASSKTTSTLSWAKPLVKPWKKKATTSHLK